MLGYRPPVSDGAAHTVIVEGRGLRIDDVVAIARHGARVEVSAAARAAIERSRAIVDRAAGSGEPVYGVSTGFGALATVFIAADQRDRLQRSLIRSHAAGVGEPVET